jgi:hypothetical protein
MTILQKAKIKARKLRGPNLLLATVFQILTGLGDNYHADFDLKIGKVSLFGTDKMGSLYLLGVFAVRKMEECTYQLEFLRPSQMAVWFKESISYFDFGYADKIEEAISEALSLFLSEHL